MIFLTYRAEFWEFIVVEFYIVQLLLFLLFVCFVSFPSTFLNLWSIFVKILNKRLYGRLVFIVLFMIFLYTLFALRQTTQDFRFIV